MFKFIKDVFNKVLKPKPKKTVLPEPIVPPPPVKKEVKKPVLLSRNWLPKKLPGIIELCKKDKKHIIISINGIEMVVVQVDFKLTNEQLVEDVDALLNIVINENDCVELAKIFDLSVKSNYVLIDIKVDKNV